MRSKMSRKWWLSAGATLGLVALVWAAGIVLAQGPDGGRPEGGGPTETFSFQGRLMDGDTPANGLYDLLVSVWDDPVLGNMVSAEEWDYSAYGVTVEDGIYSLGIPATPYGGVFNGGPRFLQVRVRPHLIGSYTTLPRIGIAAAPYAWGLRPGAVISGTVTSDSAVLRVNANGNGWAVYGNGEDVGVRAVGGYQAVSAWSTSGTGVWGGSSTGVGLVVQSATGNLIEAYDTNPVYNRRFYVSNTGHVYADGGYHCGPDYTATGAGGTLTEANLEAGPCLQDNSEADFAEALLADEGLEPGDVLVIGPTGRLLRSSEPYATNVAGVHSTRPSFLGNAGMLDQEGYVPLALVGIVPVNASAENGPIQPGDLLTSSSTPGRAMRAGHFVGGAIIGKALESLEEGTGVIQMLAMLQ